MWVICKDDLKSIELIQGWADELLNSQTVLGLRLDCTRVKLALREQGGLLLGCQLKVWVQHKYTDLLIHERQIVLELLVTGDQDSLAFRVVLRPAGSAQHLQHVQRAQLHPAALIWTVDLRKTKHGHTLHTGKLARVGYYLQITTHGCTLHSGKLERVGYYLQTTKHGRTLHSGKQAEVGYYLRTTTHGRTLHSAGKLYINHTAENKRELLFLCGPRSTDFNHSDTVENYCGGWTPWAISNRPTPQ